LAHSGAKLSAQAAVVRNVAVFEGCLQTGINRERDPAKTQKSISKGAKIQLSDYRLRLSGIGTT